MLESVTKDTLKGKAIKELQSLRTEVVDGDSADTDIPVANITTRDTLESVIEFAAGVPTDRTAACSITSDGNIQCTADTTGDKLVVRWWDKP